MYLTLTDKVSFFIHHCGIPVKVKPEAVDKLFLKTVSLSKHVLQNQSSKRNEDYKKSSQTNLAASFP